MVIVASSLLIAGLFIAIVSWVISNYTPRVPLFLNLSFAFGILMMNSGITTLAIWSVSGQVAAC